MVLVLLDALLQTLRHAVPLNLLACGGPSWTGNGNVRDEAVVAALCSGPTCLHSHGDIVQKVRLHGLASL